jgi:hypothetical protein
MKAGTKYRNMRFTWRTVHRFLMVTCHCLGDMSKRRCTATETKDSWIYNIVRSRGCNLYTGEGPAWYVKRTILKCSFFWDVTLPVGISGTPSFEATWCALLRGSVGPRRAEHYVISKRRYPGTHRSSVMSQKNQILSNTHACKNLIIRIITFENIFALCLTTCVKY